MSPTRATSQFASMEADIKELHDAVLGYNGSVPGLVSNVFVLTEKITTLSERLEDLSKNGCLFGRSPISHRVETKEENNSITFKYLVDKFFVPAVIALISGGFVVIAGHYIK